MGKNRQAPRRNLEKLLPLGHPFSKYREKLKKWRSSMSKEYVAVDTVVASLTISDASSQRWQRKWPPTLRGLFAAVHGNLSASAGGANILPRSGVLPGVRQQRRPRDRLFVDQLG